MTTADDKPLKPIEWQTPARGGSVTFTRAEIEEMVLDYLRKRCGLGADPGRR